MKIYKLQIGKLYKIKCDLFLTNGRLSWLNRNSLVILITLKEDVLGGMYIFTVLFKTETIEFSIHKTTYNVYIEEI